ncbi:MAG TPA: flagellar basal-body MS-ring/collar protein FliF [Gallionellaceae bacterium]|nr:flagellar basal-body MS-ring/collar protein FliF [Gallionellaceae bacterium]
MENNATTTTPESSIPPANPSLTGTLASLSPQQKLIMAGVASAFVAVIAGIWMWSQTPDYRVLYSNLSDRDGGSIIESLQQQNIPYKFSEGGGALLVPADKVHEVRLRLATQGLPKGGNVGFELMENQKFGISQFLEQVNYQRSLEGELARSMQTLGSVQSARVHLAIPKPTVFVKDQQKPSASVVLTLYPGRALDPGQVNAIVHLISSSIPNMPANNVTVIDQQGTLLSSIREAAETMDATQLKYVRQIEQDYIKRIEEILAPLIGAQNVHAQVTADIDFSQTEQTAEIYKPNQQANQASIRSVQSAESKNGVSNPAGVPGALSNQPPVPATAPIVSPASAVAATAGENTSSHKEATTNYEVDRTISHTKLPVGSIRRLSVAVIINNRSITDAKGKTVSKPFTPAEQAQLNNLIRNAMGFNAQRGDSLNLLNSAFSEAPEAPEIPLWKQPEMIALAKELLKYVLMAIAALYLFFGIIRPAIRSRMAKLQPPTEEEETAQAEADIKMKAKEFSFRKPGESYENSLQAAKKMAQENPQIVAAVVRDWVKA